MENRHQEKKERNKMSSAYRIEKDSMGEVKVPKAAL